MAQKTSRPFSVISVEQALEQNNAAIKGDGGAVGLTDNLDDGGWWQDQRSSGSSKSSMMQLSRRTDHKTQSIITSQLCADCFPQKRTVISDQNDGRLREFI